MACEIILAVLMLVLAVIIIVTSTLSALHVSAFFF